MVFKLSKDELTVDKEAIIQKLRISEDDMDEFNEIFEKCMSIACPKYLFAKKSTISLGVSCFLNPVSQISVNKGSKAPVLSMD